MRFRTLLLTLLAANLLASGCTAVLGINEDYQPLDDDGSGGVGATTNGGGGSGGMDDGCSDGMRNGNETDLDCGGTCPDCALGQMCVANGDCASGDCFMDVCTDRANVGGACNADIDCRSGFCVDDVCCGERCDAVCNACSQALTQLPDGTCGLTIGSDPRMDCMTGEVCIEGGCAVCGVAPTPVNTMCPAACTGGCLNNFETCVIDCSGVCPATVSCPAGFHCQVNCDGQNACANSTIICPADHDCDVLCGGGNGCRAASISCGSGPCDLVCNAGVNTCQMTMLNCGSQSCTASCNAAANLPTVNCGQSCGCVDNC